MIDKTELEIRLSDVYGESLELEALDGELDFNFRVHAERHDSIFKLMRAGCDRQLVDLQIAAFDHLASSALSSRVPTVLPTSCGQNVVEIDLEDSTRIGWMISRLSGEPLATDVDDALAQRIGQAFADLDLALEGFDHAGLARPLKWNLREAGWIKEHLPLFTNEQRRKILADICQRYDAWLGSELTALPQCVLHNDGNEGNILIDDGGEVSGIIDFGDMTRAPRICEVAIAATYAMMQARDPLQCAAAVLYGYHRSLPLQRREVDAFLPAVLTRLAVSVTNAAVASIETPDNPYLQQSARPAWNLLFRFHDTNLEAAAERFWQICQHDTLPVSSSSLLQQKRDHYFANNQRLSYAEPFMAESGERHFLTDSNGRRFLDAYNNVPHVGHCHPEVVAAVTEQLGKLNTNSRYLTELPVRYAERFCALLPDPLQRIFLLNSASEANEIALRLARAATGGKDMLVMQHGYHGCTTGAIAVSPYKYQHPGIGGAPDWVHEVPQPDPYRGDFWQTHGGDATPYLDAVDQCIHEVEAAGRVLSGFISECLPSVGGQIILPDGYLASVYEKVREAGGVCVADDVQTSLGRLGSDFWGFERAGAIPDIAVFGKPLGNGYPLAAVATTDAIADAFANGPEFFSTFGGSSASAAAGLAVLDVLEKEALQQNALKVGSHLAAGFGKLMNDHASIGDVRGSGLFWGIEMVSSREQRTPDTQFAASVKQELFNRHILVGTDGPDDNVLKIRPPMTFDLDSADWLINVLDDVLRDLAQDQINPVAGSQQ